MNFKTIFKKTAPPRGKKCIFIGRGNQNVLLRRTNIDNYCMLNRREASRYPREAENKTIRKRNAEARNRRKHHIHNDKLDETLISKKHTEGLCL